MLDEMLQRNASKFAIFLEYENPSGFFRFSFRTTLFFTLIIALVYVDIGFIRKKIKIARNEKRKNYVGFRIPKIWQILKHFLRLQYFFFFKFRVIKIAVCKK